MRFIWSCVLYVNIRIAFHANTTFMKRRHANIPLSYQAVVIHTYLSNNSKYSEFYNQVYISNLPIEQNLALELSALILDIFYSYNCK